MRAFGPVDVARKTAGVRPVAAEQPRNTGDLDTASVITLLGAALAVAGSPGPAGPRTIMQKPPILPMPRTRRWKHEHKGAIHHRKFFAQISQDLVARESCLRPAPQRWQDRNSAALFGAFVLVAPSKPVQAPRHSRYPAPRRRGLLICCTMRSVRESDAPSGNCTTTIKYPWSCGGMKPAGTLVNPKTVRPSNPT